MKFTKIAEHIYHINAGANAYLIRGERDILVDCGDPAHAGEMMTALEGIGAIDRLSLVFLSHAHHDHCGAVAQIRRLTGAKVAIFHDDAIPLEEGINTDLQAFGPFGKFAARIANSKPGPWAAIADIILQDRVDLSEYGVHCEVLHLPGHTMGSAGLLYGRALFCGDLVMGSGRFTVAPLFMYKQSEWIKSMGTAVAKAEVLYQGHGRPGMGTKALCRLVRKYGEGK